MPITTGNLEDWERIIKDLAPGFLRKRKQNVDKQVDKADPKRKKKKK